MFEEPVEKWFRLEGKTAVVTGAVGILGKYFCRGLSSVGADVAVIDLDEDSCQKFAKELRQEYGTNAMGVACDITSPEEVGQMVEEVVGTLGKINVLHNNAAAKSNDLTEYFTSFEDYSYREWQEMMRVNVDGMFLVAQAVGKQMLSQGQGGSIIQTASVYGVVAPDQRIYEGSEYMGVEINTPAVYATSKAAVIGLTKYLATYW
ncbi:MAG: SDR family NAD(P)-dependent oxidoreductase, partial [Longimicrobiales bacterium]|nr:SDR family NAD(P)-dependent oxidoreductase [Longimicrobiales bacterium]